MCGCKTAFDNFSCRLLNAKTSDCKNFLMASDVNEAPFEDWGYLGGIQQDMSSRRVVNANSKDAESVDDRRTHRWYFDVCVRDCTCIITRTIYNYNGHKNHIYIYIYTCVIYMHIYIYVCVYSPHTHTWIDVGSMFVFTFTVHQAWALKCDHHDDPSVGTYLMKQLMHWEAQLTPA